MVRAWSATMPGRSAGADRWERRSSSASSWAAASTLMVALRSGGTSAVQYPERRHGAQFGRAPSASLGNEVEDLGGYVLPHVHPAHEGAHLAPGDPLDRVAEVLLAGVLEEQPDVAQALELPHLDHRLLRGGERVLQRAHQHVGPGERRPRPRRPTAEELLVEPDELVGYQHRHRTVVPARACHLVHRDASSA